jgi:hypothetical protein
MVIGVRAHMLPETTYITLVRFQCSVMRNTFLKAMRVEAHAACRKIAVRFNQIGL